LRAHKFKFVDDNLGGFLVVPKITFAHLAVQFRALAYFSGVVKENRGWLKSAPQVHRSLVDVRQSSSSECSERL
jgi:hypothetical protein